MKNNINNKKFLNNLIYPSIVIIALFLNSCMGGMMGMGGCGMGNHSGHSGSSDHSGHDVQSTEESDMTIIRKGKIDVYNIDMNKDGYVYQDPMDWNVISDKPGICPLCGMELKKVSNTEAIKNLKDHNFEVKE